jgi:hypothetical protein
MLGAIDGRVVGPVEARRLLDSHTGTGIRAPAGTPPGVVAAATHE